MPATYKGFSTVNKRKPSFTLTDIELVKQDILNHFMTRQGERVMMPDFGSVIHNYIMEPNIDNVMEDIREEVTRIINSEPRVELNDIVVVNEDHVIRIEVSLVYSPGSVADILYLEFTKDGNETVS